jgi:hypothetical protein
VLEPEDDVRAVAERVEVLLVTALERGTERRLAAPAAAGEETRTGAPELGSRHRRHRAFVQHVLPREHCSTERRLSQRVAGALAVRDVEE